MGKIFIAIIVIGLIVGGVVAILFLLKKIKELKSKTKKEESFESNIKPLNMVSIMNTIRRKKNSLHPDEYLKELIEKLSTSFKEIENEIKENISNDGLEYNNDALQILNEVISCIMSCDGQVSPNDYNAYKKLTMELSVRALTRVELNNLGHSIDTEKLSSNLKILHDYRLNVEASVYEKFVEGFSMLSIIGDNKFNEISYFIISRLFFENYDEVPNSWEQFLKLWEQ